jgi:hypothetical protein
MVIDSRGVQYTAAVMGALADDGLWDGYIELRGVDGTTMTTPLETRQANLADLVYWSTGLSKVYLEGALVRARAATEELTAEELTAEPAVQVLERGIRTPRTTRHPSSRTTRGRSRPSRPAPSRPR